MVKRAGAGSPWEELAERAQRLPQTNKRRSSERDRALHAAVRTGSTARELADRMGISVQAVYQAIERAEEEFRDQSGLGYRETLAALEELTDAVTFEELVTLLMVELVPDLRPTQRSGDRGRDAVAGRYRVGLGEELVVTISLSKVWAGKIRSDLRRIAEQGLRPEYIYAVTNRDADERRLEALKQEASALGWGLTVFDRRWLALRLTRPENLGLRERCLGVAAPQPELFLDRAAFERLLITSQSMWPSQLVGREEDLELLAQQVDEDRPVVLEAPGGMGKSRLLAELAKREERWRWLFVREGLPVDLRAIDRLGTGDELAVVVDDAHRRSDLRPLLAGLERRNPRPRLILICRPGFRARIEDALHGLAFASPSSFVLSPLSPKAIARLLDKPPFELRFRGALAAIIKLAEGNPQIATIAAELSSKGLALQELSSDDLFRSYVAAVLREAAGDSRERLAMMALVAAVGELQLEGQSLKHAAEILGLPAPQVRREITELAERGMLVEQDGRASIKPDLLAERMLVGCFFDRSWSAALEYRDIYDRWAPTRRHEMLSVIGQALYSAGSPAQPYPELDVVRRDLLTACSEAQTPGQRRREAEALRAVAPGLPDVAGEGVGRLLDALGEDDEALLGMSKPLLDVLGHVPHFTVVWHRLLELGQRISAAAGGDDGDPVPDGRDSPEDAATRAMKALGEAFKEIHPHLPTDVSQGDGRVLAAVQELMAREGLAWWNREGAGRGAPATALLAARTMLTVIYEITRTDAVNPMQISMLSVGVPATEHTKRCLAAGIELLLVCLPRLGLRGQIRAVEVLHALAHNGLGFSGPFGLKLSDETAAEINGLVEGPVARWVETHLAGLPLPVAAQLVELFEWRAHFNVPVISLPISDALRDYRDLLHPGEHWGLQDETLPEQRERERRTAQRLADSLLKAPAQPAHLDRWSAWHRLRVDAMASDSGYMPALVLERVAMADHDSGVQAIEHLMAVGSPLLAHGSPAMTILLRARPDHAQRWSRSTSAAARVALVWAASRLEDDDQQRDILEPLARAPEVEVRDAVSRVLRYRTDLSGWRATLALEVVVADGDLRTLADVLRSRRDEAQRLSAEELTTVRAVLLGTADLPRRLDAHALTDALRALADLGHDLLWPWVWARIAAIGEHGSAARHVLDVIPDEVMVLVAQHAGSADGERQGALALDMLHDEGRDPRVERALLDLAAELAGTDHVASQLQDWAGDAGLRFLLRELLERVRDADAYARYAAVLLSVDPSDEMMDTLIHAREPMSFMGSRIPYYETAKEQFEVLEDHSDGNLVRLAHRAREYFNAHIEEERARERRRAEGYW